MPERTDQKTEFFARLGFPVTREELVNSLLVDEAPARTISVVHRLPGEVYESAEDLHRDFDEISTLDAEEVGQARTFEDLLAIVRKNVGDVDHATKALYDRVVDGVVEGAREHGNLPETEIRAMHDRLLGSYADLRRPMSESYNYDAPRDPKFDLPGKS